jgi:predicted DNA-binding transcriptional regulator AlpA
VEAAEHTQSDKQPLHFLSRTEVAEHLGLAGLHSLTGVKLPPPDVIVGDRLGWTEATIDEWQANRPGRGRWGPRDETQVRKSD